MGFVCYVPNAVSLVGAVARSAVSCAVVAVGSAEPCAELVEAAGFKTALTRVGLVGSVRFVALVGRAKLGAAVRPVTMEGVETDDRVGGRLA